ncbi:hypothetical protein GCM10009562_27200 [Nocardioides aquaticus]
MLVVMGPPLSGVSFDGWVNRSGAVRREREGPRASASGPDQVRGTQKAADPGVGIRGLEVPS